ncbi:unnamed protein product [Pleuronectes platessa]|uniref:Uncharacterized protein n=1 Tax=Pleuronectes platessa TaxID=8262 RepID=A0A9N7Y6F7_PLEPL|nr:unnamed protein product [Pleuronectes platessa]
MAKLKLRQGTSAPTTCTQEFVIHQNEKLRLAVLLSSLLASGGSNAPKGMARALSLQWNQLTLLTQQDSRRTASKAKTKALVVYLDLTAAYDTVIATADST